jgi:6-phosphogluconolactonase
VYETTNQVSLFPINQTTGPLMGTGVLLPLAATAAPQACVADPGGRFLYVANTGTNTVSTYLINAGTGSLTEIVGSPFSIVPGTGPVSLSADPLGQFLYVANGSTNNVAALAIDQTSGSLSAVAGSPFALAPATSPQSIAVDLSGRFAYVANASGTVTAFAINQTTGALSAVGSPFPAGLNPSAIATIGRF